jgi:hypothetical protein
MFPSSGPFDMTARQIWWASCVTARCIWPFDIAFIQHDCMLDLESVTFIMTACDLAKSNLLVTKMYRHENPIYRHEIQKRIFYAKLNRG